MLQCDTVRKLKLDVARSESNGKSADPFLHRESAVSKNCSDATGYFKNQIDVGVVDLIYHLK
jgi:hypothetical protein